MSQMPDERLPAELEQIERRLASRARGIAPPPRLRSRVIGAVRGELRAGPRVRNGWWQFAAALAAMVLLGLNMALASAPSEASDARVGRTKAATNVFTQRLRELLPELREEELRAFVALRSLGGRTVISSAAPIGTGGCLRGIDPSRRGEARYGTVPVVG